MDTIQIASVDEPYASPAALALAYALVARAQMMGFLPRGTPSEVTLGQPLISEIAREVERAGIAVAPASRLRRGGKDDLLAALRATVEAVDASPRPDGEWGPVRDVLPDELLARVLGGLSETSVRRYAMGRRPTPDDVAWRLHVVARLLAALIGSYNAYGIRRWFVRSRTALDGVAPADVLADASDEDDARLKELIALAEDLMGAGSGT